MSKNLSRRVISEKEIDLEIKRVDRIATAEMKRKENEQKWWDNYTHKAEREYYDRAEY